MKINPIGNRVLIEPIKEQEKTVSGIILSNSITSNVGLVTAIGNIHENINLGDKIFYKPQSGIEIIDLGQKYLILDVEDILAVIK